MAQPGLSQIFGWCVLCQRWDSVLYLAKVSVPLLGTSLILTPEISGFRSIVHFILFALCFYFGFIKTPKDSGK